ncbi:hypothetical protein SAY87_006406 [Trapa incisa]|uniref:Sugar phosphate transporter domain-containing protein n=1 Tax=Trapa incisa TaxID=236973 RepID=A0AAN7JZE1_9MYRT|nr:hypothetical protein SAY87_006406 [Trapa incisa]
MQSSAFTLRSPSLRCRPAATAPGPARSFPPSRFDPIRISAASKPRSRPPPVLASSASDGVPSLPRRSWSLTNPASSSSRLRRPWGGVQHFGSDSGNISFEVRAASVPETAGEGEKSESLMKTLELGLLFGLWYLFNIYFNIYNKQVPHFSSFSCIMCCNFPVISIELSFLTRIDSFQGSMDNITLFSIITMMSFVLLFPVACYLEGFKFSPAYFKLAAEQGMNVKQVLSRSLLAALCFHAYQQVSYMILQRVSPVTHSVGNCVKRVVVIVSSVIFFKTPVSPINSLGTGIALAGVFLYSRVKRIKPKPKAA